MSCLNMRSENAAPTILLTLLAVQTSATSLLLTHSRKPSAEEPDKPIYAISTAVLLGELLKGLTSATAVLAQRLHHHHRAQHSGVEKNSLKRSLVASFPVALSETVAELSITSGLGLSVPAVLYVVQSNLQFLAASSLGAAQYQILSQIKIISTAIFSACLLGRALNPRQWTSVLALAAGVAVVQVSSTSRTQGSEQKASSFTGFAAVMAGSTLSGFAGVLTERILKRSTISIFASNFHMSCFSLIPALIVVLMEGLHAASLSAEHTPTGQMRHGWSPMRGFDLIAWSVVILNAAGGLLVSASVKWVDSIAKTFASSLAILISLIITYLFIDSNMTANVGLLVGTLVILCAALCFNRDAAKATAIHSGYTAVSNEPGTLESSRGLLPASVEMRQASPA